MEGNELGIFSIIFVIVIYIYEKIVNSDNININGEMIDNIILSINDIVILFEVIKKVDKNIFNIFLIIGDLKDVFFFVLGSLLMLLFISFFFFKRS